MEVIIMSVITLLFICIGIVLSLGKSAFLIAGYNTMTKEENENYDQIALTKFMGKATFALSFCLFLWTLDAFFKTQWLFTIGLILFFAIIIFILVYANTGNRFKK